MRRLNNCGGRSRGTTACDSLSMGSERGMLLLIKHNGPEWGPLVLVRSLLCDTTWCNLARDGSRDGGGSSRRRGTRHSSIVVGIAGRATPCRIVRRSYLSLARTSSPRIPHPSFLPRASHQKQSDGDGHPAVYCWGSESKTQHSGACKTRLLLDLISFFLSCSRRLLLHFHSLLSLSSTTWIHNSCGLTRSHAVVHMLS